MKRPPVIVILYDVALSVRNRTINLAEFVMALNWPIRIVPIAEVAAARCRLTQYLISRTLVARFSTAFLLGA
jgi:hypothetical protein